MFLAPAKADVKAIETDRRNRIQDESLPINADKKSKAYCFIGLRVGASNGACVVDPDLSPPNSRRFSCSPLTPPLCRSPSTLAKGVHLMLV
jgi:hypothetical protein